MTRKQVNELIKKNDVTQLKDLFTLCLNKSDSLNKRCNQLTLYGLILGIIYCLSLNTKVSDIEIGIFKISDLVVFQKLTPLIFAYFLLEWYLTSNHRYNVANILVSLSHHIYYIPESTKNYKSLYVNEFTPFFISNEIVNKLLGRRLWGPIGYLFLWLIINWLSISFLLFSITHSITVFKIDFFTIAVDSVSMSILIYLFFDKMKQFNTREEEDDGASNDNANNESKQ